MQTLNEEHCLRPDETKIKDYHVKAQNPDEEDETERLSDDDDDDDITEHPPHESSSDPELGIGLTNKNKTHHQDEGDDDGGDDDTENPYGEETSFMIRIPTPGLHNMTDATDQTDATTVTTTTSREETTTRLVSGLCTICLCNYQVGSDIVWSSNAACEHCFHENCIEWWLIKQKEGPLCPCCRRDFVVDPYDLEEEDGDSTPKNHYYIRRPREQMSTRRLWLNWTGSLDETVAMDQESLDV